MPVQNKLLQGRQGGVYWLSRPTFYVDIYNPPDNCIIEELAYLLLIERTMEVLSKLRGIYPPAWRRHPAAAS